MREKCEWQTLELWIVVRDLNRCRSLRLSSRVVILCDSSASCALPVACTVRLFANIIELLFVSARVFAPLAGGSWCLKCGRSLVSSHGFGGKILSQENIKYFVVRYAESSGGKNIALLRLIHNCNFDYRICYNAELRIISYKRLPQCCHLVACSLETLSS